MNRTVHCVDCSGLSAAFYHPCAGNLYARMKQVSPSAFSRRACSLLSSYDIRTRSRRLLRGPAGLREMAGLKPEFTSALS